MVEAPGHVDTSVVMNEMIRRSEDSLRRIRYLEEYIRTLEAKFDALESSSVSKENEITKNFNDLSKSLQEIGTQILKIDNDVNGIKRSLSKFAKKADLSELTNYIDLISPMKSSFVTRSELESILKKG